MNLADELQKLAALHRSGGLSDDEFVKAKAALLGTGYVGVGELDDDSEEGVVMTDSQTNLWAMFLHFSILAGYLVPFAGLIVPIAIWQLKKTEMPAIDVHGKIVANWIITHIIFAIVCGLLVLVVIGIPLLIILGILSILFPIIGGIKANSGEAWRYPMSIRFF